MVRIIHNLVVAAAMVVPCAAAGVAEGQPGPGELARFAPASQPAAARPGPKQTRGETDKAKIVRFAKPTEAEAQAALDAARAKAVNCVQRLKINLRLVETRHFLIYTDWPRGEHKWLGSIFEEMYRGLARQFGADPDESVFLGKLPVFAFDRQESFRRFASTIDGFTGQALDGAGYAWCQGIGPGHMVLWRCGERAQLAALIVHEGTHAFLGRYRTNLDVASWIHEGLADYMVQVGVPNSTALEQARAGAIGLLRRRTDLKPLFSEEDNIPFDLYPAAVTITDMLIRKDRKGYVELVNDCKDGMDTEAALKKHFGWDYAELLRRWGRWAERGFK